MKKILIFLFLFGSVLSAQVYNPNTPTPESVDTAIAEAIAEALANTTGPPTEILSSPFQLPDTGGSFVYTGTQTIDLLAPTSPVEGAIWYIYQDNSGKVGTSFQVGTTNLNDFYRTTDEGNLMTIQYFSATLGYRVINGEAYNYVSTLTNYFVAAGGANSPDNTDIIGWNSGTNNIQLNTNISNVRTGTTSLLLEDEVGVAALANVRHDIDVNGGNANSGDTIQVSCWFKCATDVEFRLRGQEPLTSSGFTFGTGDWQLIEVPAFVTDGTFTRVVLNVRGPDDAATYPCYIDDITFNVIPQ